MDRMEHTMSIRLSQCDGAVMKALDLMERRGFRLLTCNLAEGDHNGREMEVTVSSHKPGDLLKRQLERLCDVILVEELSAAINPTATNVQDITWRISNES